VTASTPTRTLQDVLDSVPSFVDHLYSNRKGSVLKDAVLRQPTEFVAPEFTTWRDEQRACPPGGRRHAVADLVRDRQEVRQGAGVSIAASCASAIEIEDGAGHGRESADRRGRRAVFRATLLEADRRPQVGARCAGKNRVTGRHFVVRRADGLIYAPFPGTGDQGPRAGVRPVTLGKAVRRSS